MINNRAVNTGMEWAVTRYLAPNPLVAPPGWGYSYSSFGFNLAAVVLEKATGETFVNIEAERGFGDNWFGELRVRAFSGAEQGDNTYWLQNDDYVQLSLSRYF